LGTQPQHAAELAAENEKKEREAAEEQTRVAESGDFKGYLMESIVVTPHQGCLMEYCDLKDPPEPC
jgi:hypothetical protein